MLITPLYETFNTLLKSGRRLIVEEFARFGNICPSLWHVAGLLRQAINNRLLTHHFLDGGNHLGKRDRLVVTEINHFVISALIMQRAKDAFDDVGNKGVVTASGAIAEDRDRLAGFDQADEFIDREIGTLARAIDGEEAQT